MIEEVLRTNRVSKRYGAVQALRDASVAVGRGEVLALVGENGSGKSTLARILAGVIPPDSGGLILDGQPVRFSSPRAALRHGVAIVTQELTCIPTMTVAENILLPRLTRAFRLVDHHGLVQRARRYLDEVGLGEIDPMMPFRALRQGDREMVEVAKALATRPRVLILDEATTRLPDPERLFSIVDRLASQDISTIFITHRLREIGRLAHRAVVLRDGEVVRELQRGELSDAIIAAAMVGRPLDHLYAKARVVIGGTVLAMSNVTTSRNQQPVNLLVRAGEIVGLAGLVGSGRTELLEGIAGARPRTSGFVTVAGVEVPKNSPTAAVRAGIGFVPEDRRVQGLHLSAGVADNLSMVWLRALQRINRHLHELRAHRAIQRFNIRTPTIHTPVGDLSGGNQQKVLIARALAHHPKVLLLDEPTRGVDVGAKHEIYRFIADLVQGGVGVLLASSDLLELLGLCDRILVLYEGAFVGELQRGFASEERIALLATGGKVNTS